MPLASSTMTVTSARASRLRAAPSSTTVTVHFIAWPASVRGFLSVALSLSQGLAGRSRRYHCSSITLAPAGVRAFTWVMDACPASTSTAPSAGELFTTLSPNAGGCPRVAERAPALPTRARFVKVAEAGARRISRIVWLGVGASSTAPSLGMMMKRLGRGFGMCSSLLLWCGCRAGSQRGALPGLAAGCGPGRRPSRHQRSPATIWPARPPSTRDDSRRSAGAAFHGE